MKAFHTAWAKPYFSSRPNLEKNVDNFVIPDYDLLTTILSALKWREKNGSIKLHADEISAEYYRRRGMEVIWDLGIDTSIESEINPNIDFGTFWSISKLYGLKKEEAPVMIIDRDFIIWVYSTHY